MFVCCDLSSFQTKDIDKTHENKTGQKAENLFQDGNHEMFCFL